MPPGPSARSLVVPSERPTGLAEDDRYTGSSSATVYRASAVRTAQLHTRTTIRRRPVAAAARARARQRIAVDPVSARVRYVARALRDGLVGASARPRRPRGPPHSAGPAARLGRVDPYRDSKRGVEPYSHEYVRRVLGEGRAAGASLCHRAIAVPHERASRTWPADARLGRCSGAGGGQRRRLLHHGKAGVRGGRARALLPRPQRAFGAPEPRRPLPRAKQHSRRRALVALRSSSWLTWIGFRSRGR